MILDEKDTRHETVMETARAMMAAARTAPKGRGVDRLEIRVAHGEELARLAAEMRVVGERAEMAFFLRDADNMEQAEAVILIGTTFGAFGLNCGYCGFETCAEKERHPAIPCAINTGDLGIAIGSAVSLAADRRIDSRVMYSAGKAALSLGLLPGCGAAFGILLSCTSKNPFFDRVPKQ